MSPLNTILKKGGDIMLNSKELLKQLEGKSKEDAQQIIQDALGIDFSSFGSPDLPCTLWFSTAFCYCSVSDLNEQLLNFSLFLNLVIGPIFGFCYKPGDVTSLGCNCPCGSKEIVMHFQLTRKDCPL